MDENIIWRLKLELGESHVIRFIFKFPLNSSVFLMTNDSNKWIIYTLLKFIYIIYRETKF